MKSADLRKLQGMIDRVVKHGAVYHVAQATLNEWCLAHYGKEPGDIDADEIIDTIFGGDGHPSAMSAERFNEIMEGDGHA